MGRIVLLILFNIPPFSLRETCVPSVPFTFIALHALKVTLSTLKSVHYQIHSLHHFTNVTFPFYTCHFNFNYFHVLQVLYQHLHFKWHISFNIILF
jgi:hypothetical protein